jgi:hypothetical protein
VPFLSKTFAQAAQIAEKIESLEKRLSVFIQGAAPNGSGDGRGTLRPAVVAILKESDRPLKDCGFI